MLSMLIVRPVLRRGRRQGWKRIGRRPDASDPGGPKARPTPGPERRPDRRQERRLSAYRTPNVPERSGRGEQGRGPKGRRRSEPRGRRKAPKLKYESFGVPRPSTSAIAPRPDGSPARAAAQPCP